jgi:hypothetical protein
MKDKEIIEGNKLIASFDPQMIVHKLDRRSNENRNYLDGLKYEGFKKGDIGNIRGTEHLQYHTSWDWLMPVIEKILAMYDSQCSFEHPKYLNIDNKHRFSFNLIDDCRGSQSGEGNTLIEASYNAVVKFIKWYNNKK